MKHVSLLSASAAVLLAGSANASLIFGISSFANDTTTGGTQAGTPQVNLPGFEVELRNGVRTATTDAQLDSTFGSFAGPPAAQTNNFAYTSSVSDFGIALVNNSAYSSPLGALTFDAAALVEGVYDYSIVANGLTLYTGSVALNGILQPMYFPLSPALVLGAGSANALTLTFDRFAIVDNLALIPEPSGALALAGLMGAGLLLRNRRSSVEAGTVVA